MNLLIGTAAGGEYGAVVNSAFISPESGQLLVDRTPAVGRPSGASQAKGDQPAAAPPAGARRVGGKPTPARKGNE